MQVYILLINLLVLGFVKIVISEYFVYILKRGKMEFEIMRLVEFVSHFNLSTIINIIE